jgi:hypothetical protein
MGLEMVEIVMAVEETFGVLIPDERAHELQTVGKLFDYVKAQCLSGTQVTRDAHFIRDLGAG